MEKQLKHDNFTASESWKSQWNEAVPVYSQDLQCITTKPAGLDSPPKIWPCANSLRTGHGRCCCCCLDNEISTPGSKTQRSGTNKVLHNNSDVSGNDSTVYVGRASTLGRSEVVVLEAEDRV
ncbi:hypothetical protein QE152_g32405 [Popillia japonica]|uniref:Uncharacterized protein n=1 Tax=Popillia japonica TaxID=7064 RepID=A0AAW1IZ65_POPJA